MTDSERIKKDIVLDCLKEGNCSVSEFLIFRAFPNPKRPTVEDMEMCVQEKLGLLTILDRGTVAHVYHPRREEQIDQFLDRFCLEMRQGIEDPSIYHFRIKLNQNGSIPLKLARWMAENEIPYSIKVRRVEQ